MLSPRGLLLFAKVHTHTTQPQKTADDSTAPTITTTATNITNTRASPGEPQQQPQEQQHPHQQNPFAQSLAGSRPWDSSPATQKDESGCTDRNTSGCGSKITTATTIPPSPADSTTAHHTMTVRPRPRLGPGAGSVVVSTPAAASPLTSHCSSPQQTTTSPVCIPSTRHQQREAKKRYNRHQHQPARRDNHSPDAIPPSVAALLAVTSIPRSRLQRSSGLAVGVARQRVPHDDSMTVDAIMQRAQRTEKEISLSLSGDPMGLLLGTSDKGQDSDSAPFATDFDDDASSVAGSTHSTNLSGHTISVESFLSLGDSFASLSSQSQITSPRTPATPPSPYTPSCRSASARRRSSHGPLRRRLEPVSPPSGSTASDDHPLAAKRPAASAAPIDELDFRVFASSPAALSEWRGFDMALPLQPLKSAFKSNLTASLRALKNAARSISTLGQASIPPEDFLTRSILTIDPRVPFTDERRPPQLDEEPSAALRRYLNPTTSARMESRPPSAPPAARSSFTASIQMQTYKVRRDRPGADTASSSGIPHPSPQLGQPPVQDPTEGAAGLEAPNDAVPPGSSDSASAAPPAPLVIPGRQREMRENSDFIRIAVMEMAMRKRGKLDDQRPGRARWALPARRTSTTPYQVGPDGVPVRWVAIAAM
ncbi:hypothetical protein RB595_001219 [Gaeumannomyces hyphopodioides]